MTRRERTFSGTVNDTTSVSPRTSKPNASTARPPLSGIPLAPMLRTKTPSDLHTGREVGFKLRDQETNEPRECRGVTDFHGPQTEAVLVKVGFYTRNKGVAFLL